MNTYTRNYHRIYFDLSVVGWSFFPLPPAPPLLPGGGQREKMPGLVTQISSATVFEVLYYSLCS